MEQNNLQQSIFKKVKKDSQFAQVSNELINNRGISYKALGILTYIISKPNDWNVYISDLIREGKDGEKSVRSGINELIENKYMQRYRVYDAETKKVNHWETLVSEEPFDESQLISVVREKYLKDNEGIIVRQKIKFGNFERYIPIVLEREVELLSQKVKVAKVKVGKEGQQILTPTKTYSTNTNSEEETSLPEVHSNLIYKTYEEAKGSITPGDKKQLDKLLNLYSEELVIKAIDEMSLRAEKKNLKYVINALKDWSNRGLTTLEEVNLSMAKHETDVNKARKNKNKKTEAAAENKSYGKEKKSTFTDYEQRTYDFDSLEKKLLGWDNNDSEVDV